MEYTTLHGATNLSCSRIGLGTWAIGGWMWGGSDEERSIRRLVMWIARLACAGRRVAITPDNLHRSHCSRHRLP